MAIQDTKNKKQIVRVGSRTSVLAMKQTHLIIDLLSKTHPNIQFDVVSMETIGDKILDKALSKIGDKSLFTKELEIALLNKDVDFVVHSLKDVPTYIMKELVLGCICMRECSDDAVVMKQGSVYQTLNDLPDGSIIGTSSVRRMAQLKRKYPNFRFESVRGNLHTRLRKLDMSEDFNYSAIILAKAGLERIGLQKRISQVLSGKNTLYAVGQGALTCQCRSDDEFILKILASIHNDQVGVMCIAERSLMRQLNGGCSTPIAVKSTISAKGVLCLKAAVMSPDGSQHIQEENRIILPEDVEGLMDTKSSNYEEECPIKKKSKQDDLKYVKISEKERQLGRDINIDFLGLRVSPICEIGRMRMAVAELLGADLARKLVESGAQNILDTITKTRGELEMIEKSSKSEKQL